MLTATCMHPLIDRSSTDGWQWHAKPLGCARLCSWAGAWAGATSVVAGPPFTQAGGGALSMAIGLTLTTFGTMFDSHT